MAEPRLPRSAHAWGTPAFEATLKSELADEGAAWLPLQACLSHTSVALTDDIEIVLLGSEPRGGRVLLRVGVFFQGLQAGCGCADDPTPVEPETEYCELSLILDPSDGRVTLTGG